MHRSRASTEPANADNVENPEKPQKPAELRPEDALYGNVERDMNTEVKVTDLSEYVTALMLNEGLHREYTVSDSGRCFMCFHVQVYEVHVHVRSKCTDMYLWVTKLA